MRGGIYTYHCPKWGKCDRGSTWDVDSDKRPASAARRYGEACRRPKQAFTPILCEALGVHSSQVAEHRRVHPDIPMTDDGRVVMRSYRENVCICKKLGF